MASKTKQEKHERFVRTAELRVNATIADIRKLAKCASRSHYEYTQDEADQIVQNVENEFAQMKKLFEQNCEFSIGVPGKERQPRQPISQRV